jgi:hypothetical protein
MFDAEFRERNASILRLHLENYSLVDIAGNCGITRQRVQAILKKQGFQSRNGIVPLALRRPLHRPLRRTTSERFWSQVEISPDVAKCWLWTGGQMGGTSHSRYGSISGLGRKWYSHHLAWYLSRRRLPTLWILHECGNSLCCNPSHLYEGTPQQNAKDRFRHMRERGELHPQTKLTVDQIKALRAAKATRSVSRLAREFGISKLSAWLCANGMAHSHVE